MKTAVYWEWEEAFSKFGFDDGDGPNFTRTVEEFLYDIGWNAEPDDWGIHNFMIKDITGPNNEKPMIGYVVGYDCPRTYLPTELIKALDEKFPRG
jgi:hypothetical protein